jgi:hypothetical protein
MVWKITDGDAIAPIGKMFTTKGVKIPPTWNSWTNDNKKIHGLYWEDDPTPLPPFDNFYYYGWNSDGDALLPRPIADLKIIKLSEAKSIAHSMLSSTDWYITRKSETSTAVPSNITAFRTAVRTNYGVLKTAINNASDVDALKACYAIIAGASQENRTINATSNSVVNVSDNTITSNGHGFVNDEQVHYNVGSNSSGEFSEVIGGLVHGTTYYIISATTNTFKLSESHSNCGDATAISLTSLSTDGTAQYFTSQGMASVGHTFPNSNMSKYGV